MSLKHTFESASPDGPDTTKLRPSNYGSIYTDYTTDPTHEFTGGAHGSLLVRHTTAVDGADYVPTGAGFLAATGVGQMSAFRALAAADLPSGLANIIASGPTQARTYTLPDADATIVTANSVASLKSLTLGQNIADPGRIEFPRATGCGPCVIDHSIGSDVNPHLYMGYNIDAETWGLIDPTDQALFWGIEGDYDDGSGQNKMEGYLQFQFTAGFGGTGNITYRRPIMAQVNKSTQQIVALQLCGGSSGMYLGINDGTGTDIEKVVGKTKLKVDAALIAAYVATQFDSTIGVNGAVNSSLYSANIGGTFGDVEGTAGMSISSVHAPTSARTNVYGLLMQPIFNPSSNKLAAPTAILAKAYSKPQMALSTTVAHDTLAGVTARAAIIAGATLGTITGALCFYAQAPLNEASAPTVVLSRSRGMQIDNVGTPGGNAGISVDTAAGLVIAEISGAANANYGLQLGSTSVPAGGSYSIYNGSAFKSFFNAQVGIGTNSPNANAILDLVSTTKPFMPPRMTTTQRDAVSSPTAGMVIYNSSTGKLNLYTTTWEAVTSA